VIWHYFVFLPRIDRYFLAIDGYFLFIDLGMGESFRGILAAYHLIGSVFITDYG